MVSQQSKAAADNDPPESLKTDKSESQVILTPDISSSGSEDKPPVEEKDKPPAVRNLYEGPSKCKCCINWVETAPEVPEAKVTPPGTVVTVRYNQDHDAEKALALHSLLVHTKPAKDALRRVFRGLPDIVIADSSDFVLKRPFEPVFHRWAVLTTMAKAEIVKDDEDDEDDEAQEDDEQVQHLRVVYDILSAELGDFFKEVNDLLADRCVTYKLLWTLFRPGEIVVGTNAHGDPQAATVISTKYQSGEKPCFLVYGKCIDSSGVAFGYCRLGMELEPFQGPRLIETLNPKPLSYFPDPERLRNTLVERGRRFAQLTGQLYMAYKGTERVVRDGKFMAREVLFISQFRSKRFHL
jgi:hypothetical protein